MTHSRAAGCRQIAQVSSYRRKQCRGERRGALCGRGARWRGDLDPGIASCNDTEALQVALAEDEQMDSAPLKSERARSHEGRGIDLVLSSST